MFSAPSMTFWVMEAYTSLGPMPVTPVMPGRCRRQGGRRRQGTQGSNHGLRATRQAAVNHDGLGLQARDDPPAWWLTTVAHQPQGIKRRTTGGRVLLRMQQVAPAQIGGIFDEAGAGAGRVSLRLGSELIGATLPDGIEHGIAPELLIGRLLQGP